MQRDRSQTERRLIEAVGFLIAEEGPDSLGINRIARLSKVNKVLIYRYFGGLDGLVQAYYERSQSRPTVALTASASLTDESASAFFDTFYPALIQVFRQGRHDADTPTLPQAEQVVTSREQPTAETYQLLTDMLAEAVGGPVGQAYATLIINGLLMLHLQRTTSHLLPGLPDDDRWPTVEAAVQFMFQGTVLLLEKRQRANNGRKSS